MLLKTTDVSQGKKHRHFAYLPKAATPDQQIWTSNEDNHAHQVIVDPQTGAFSTLAAGVPLHDHLIEPLVGAKQDLPKETDDSDEEVVAEVREKFKMGYDSEADSRKQAQEAIDFYRGKQWNDGDKSALEKDARACITINEIAPKIDMLAGYQRQNRTDVRYFPTEEGDKIVSEILTILTKNIFDRNNMEQVESGVFQDELKAGRGLFHAYIDYTKDIRGDIRVEQMSWADAWFGPHDKLDLSDCEWMIKSKMFALDKIKKMYPDSADKIDTMFSQYEEGQPRESRVPIGNRYEFGTGSELNTLDIDTEKDSVRVYEMWEKEYSSEWGVVQYDDEYVDNLSGLTSNDVKQLEQLKVDAVKKVKQYMCVYTVCGNVLLDKRTEDIDSFPVICAYAKKDENGFYGKVTEVMDCQREINKRHSQAIDVVNRVSSYGYFYDGQTFDDPKEENFFKQGTSTSGFVVKVRDQNRVPQKVEGVRMPTELVGMLELASAKLGVIMNITPETMGFNQREVSSVSLMETRKNAMTAQEFLFDNLAQAKKQLALLLVKLMKKIYSPDRIIRIIRSPRVTSQEQLMVNQLQDDAIRTLLTETDLSQYDVSIGLSPTAPSIRSANFALLLELIQRGAPIPPEVLIEASDLPNKEKILGTLQAQAQAAAEAAKSKENMEIQKTQIAANAKMAGKGGAAAPSPEMMAPPGAMQGLPPVQ